MSRNDYTKYARENKAEKPEAPVVESETIETPIMETESVIHPEGVFPIPVEEVPEVTESPSNLGRVIGCTKLNVRRAPKPRAEVVCEINCGTEVEIDYEASTIDFYKICTASGVEGYCVKTYISADSNN